ncbi:TetR/AcrR family transcriptional regulator [Mesorhizobium microcysteis]|uniref:TetR/AcrR family transcriptional regulator n=2 Tax=Neoaquamicrobium microcysteis TaxID=2682781 RepID=A0A5D4H406_9HYPH|nr:TetR/AcrR family transcriptional regulator [Mesorhizobium microcysteis]
MKAPGKRNSRRRPRDERMSEIMTVTRRMLAERGYENVVTTEVAQICGISEGTIFRYFPTKRDLLIKVAEAWFEEILSLPADGSIHGSARERLRYEVGLALSIIRREPSLTRFVLMELRPDPTYRTMHIYQLNRRFTSRILDALKAAIASGELTDDVSAELLRNMIFGCIEHQTWAFLRKEGDFSVEEARDAITTVIWRGMEAETADNRLDRLDRSIARLEKVAAALDD